MLIAIDLYALTLTEDIVVCQTHPALVKIGLVLACLFHFEVWRSGGFLETPAPLARLNVNSFHIFF